MPTPQKTADSRQPLELSELSELSTVAELEPYVSDRREQARIIVAERLERARGPGAVRLLEALARDGRLAVVARAIAALAARKEPDARAVLRSILQRRSEGDEADLVRIMHDQVGGAGLMALLWYVPRDAKRGWDRQQSVFQQVEALADPRAADALVAFLHQKPHPHFRYRAAAALATLGDVRAVPHLAWRLREDPGELYSDELDWEMPLRHDDHERAVVARLIAELGRLHPEQKTKLRGQAEDALLFWVHELPTPHAAAMRALAELDSERGRSLIRAWANAREALPKQGQRPPMPERFAIAQSALRSMGRLKDEASWPVLLKALEARPAQVDLTENGIMKGEFAILGMSVRALQYGASDGLSEWGAPRAFDPLVKFIAGVRENEQARIEACRALPWVGGKDAGARILKLVERYDEGTKEDEFRRECLLRGLVVRPVGAPASELVELMTQQHSQGEGMLAARALGRLGFGDRIEDALVQRIDIGSAAAEATLALMLAGKTALAKRALTTLGMADTADLRAAYNRSFDFLSEDDLSSGYLFGVVELAEELAHFDIQAETQAWAKGLLAQRLYGVVYDDGPHSLTRLVLRNRLFYLAKSPNPKSRSAALALRYFGAEGSLMALQNEAHVDHDYVRELLVDLRAMRKQSQERRWPLMP